MAHTEQFDLDAYQRACQARVNARMDHWLKQQNGLAPRLVEAMAYATFNGGKRVRPVLAYAAEALGGRQVMVDDIAAALEMVHFYSLVHDDLPAMDDDTTCRKQAHLPHRLRRSHGHSGRGCPAVPGL
ncbi:MAG: polyprenyl synthetase family protein [Gammaproteobacteria bacterium]